MHFLWLWSGSEGRCGTPLEREQSEFTGDAAAWQCFAPALLTSPRRKSSNQHIEYFWMSLSPLELKSEYMYLKKKNNH